jgi:O-glycosyl hydrolase
MIRRLNETAFLAPQTALSFSESRPQLIAIDVNDQQRFQTIDGFGVALTGGSAELLMRMAAERRTALLRELFATKDNGISISYLRVSMGASDMNARVYSYDDVPAGATDVDLAKFSLDPDRADVIPALKQILAINPNLEILGSPWSAPAWMKTNDIAEPVSEVLIGVTRNWSRNVLLWNLAADPNNGPHTNDGGCSECRGAITLDGNEVTRNVAYYALAHFSRLVPPGSVRIGSNDLEQLANVAFLTPDGKVVLVVSNTSNFPKTFDVRYRGRAVTAS